MENKNKELENAKGLTKFLYKGMDWLGLTSGIGIVAWGAWWFIWSLINYFTVQAESAIQQMVEENYFNQSLLSAILIALGVLIMEIKKKEKE